MDHAKIDRYLELLLQANQTMNLTRITDPAAARAQHVDDALTLLPHLPEGEIHIGDVGSGGGVPGMILAIARPEARVTLIESTQKKAKFLKETAGELGLNNVRVLALRAEEVGHGPRRQSFDVVTARAVATMVWLAEWCLPLARVGGKMLAMKGPKVMDELPTARHAIEMLGGGEATIHPAPLPGREGLVIIEIAKLRPTDRRLPRPADRAKGKPLTRL